ncbi:MAG: sugar-binding domain-containing protein, partial [bacterium]
MTMHFSISPRIRRSLLIGLAGVLPPIFLQTFPGTAELLAQQLSPSFSKTINSRTTAVKNSWEVDFELSQPAQVVAHFQLSSETDWENPQLPAVFLEVLIDDRLASHLVTYMGRSFHDYSVHLGALIAGPHNLAFQRADSSTAALKLREVRIDIYEKAHPFFSVLAHAPIIFGRSRRGVSAGAASGAWLDPDMRRSDVPMLLAYDERPLSLGKARTYTVFFSNENGGTPPPGLLHLWGRYTDIEWAYRVELDDTSKRHRAFFQGPKHQKLIYRGGFENDQPTLQVATLNNMFSDSLTTKLRFALPPIFNLPPESPRESVMQQAPWIWQVSAKEARREQLLDPSPTDSTRIADLQRYLYIQFAAQPEKIGVKSGGFFIAKFKKYPNTSASNLWSDHLIIRGDTTIIRQTAVSLPPGASPDDLQRLEFVADAGGGSVVLTSISRLFSLDKNDLPQAWKPDWHGRQRLEPGQRAVFYAEDFRLHPVYFQALPKEWHFKPDSQAMATATTWGGKPVDETQWPLLRIGEPWERQGYSGYDGVAWYRCQFRLDNSWQGERLWLGFGSVDDRYQVWVNGKLARDLPTDSIGADGHLTFTEITKLAQFEHTNSVVVRVEDFGGEGGIVAPPAAISNFPEALAPPRVTAMADPAMDRDEPFDYFQKPIAILGTKDHPGFTLVTPEGYLNTGWAEIMFLGGADLAPLSCRVKTLTAEGLPIVRYRTRAGGVEYEFEAFAFPAAGDSAAAPFNWVRVRVQNRNSTSTEAKFAVAPRFNNTLHPLAAKHSFNPNWHYKVDGRLLLRDEQALMVLPETPSVANFSNGAAPAAETPAGRVEYRWTLAP